MNERAIPLIVDLPRPVAKAAIEGGRRFIYFEATRDNGGVDREGEQVAADGLWASRDEFMAQGNLDIAHWAWLPNPVTGRPDPEYVIGLPDDVRRSGNSIFVKGEVFQAGVQPAPEESNAQRAEKFWYSQAVQDPPMKYFPSVYGDILPGGVELVKVKGKLVRRITKVVWKSVGFWTRAQHPDLPAVSTRPIGPLAKAEQGFDARAAFSGAVQMSWGNFAKACSVVGAPVTDHAQLTGVQALMRGNVEKTERGIVVPAKGADQVRHAAARVVVLRALKAGKIEGSLASLARAFASQGLSREDARTAARKLHADLNG